MHGTDAGHAEVRDTWEHPPWRALQESGRRVRVLDSLLHGQQQVAAEQRAAGVEVIEGDVRDPEARAQGA